MEKKIFRDLIDLTEDYVWEEFHTSAKYKRLLDEKSKAMDIVAEQLDDDYLIELLSNKILEVNQAYHYLLCQKMVKNLFGFLSAADII